MVIELAILTPFVIVMLLVVVAFGRVTHARSLMDAAAAAGARAASLTSTPGQADAEAICWLVEMATMPAASVARITRIMMAAMAPRPR